MTHSESAEHLQPYSVGLTPLTAVQLPLAQTMPQVPQWLGLFLPTQLPPQQYFPVPHEVPFETVRVQLCDCELFDDAHEPLLHVYLVTVRDWEPVVSQALAKPPHVLHDPYVVFPQLVPSVVRVQLCVSVLIAF